MGRTPPRGSLVRGPWVPGRGLASDWLRDPSPFLVFPTMSSPLLSFSMHPIKAPGIEFAHRLETLNKYFLLRCLSPQVCNIENGKGNHTQSVLLRILRKCLLAETAIHGSGFHGSLVWRQGVVRIILAGWLFSLRHSFSRTEYFQNIYWQQDIDDITEVIPALLSCLIPQLNTVPMSTALSQEARATLQPQRLLATQDAASSLY